MPNRSFVSVSMFWREIRSSWLVLLLAAFVSACPLLGQSGTTPTGPKVETFDVVAGPLELKSVPKTNEPRTIIGRKPRTQNEVKALVDEMAQGYRSACCPHQKMNDRSCPCQPFQIGMLTFLVELGFDRSEVDEFMVTGKPTGIGVDGQAIDLRAEFQKWLQHVWMPSNHERGGKNEESYFRIDFFVRGKMETYGWDHGWSELIREAPHDWTVYLLVGSAGLLVLGGFGFGVVLLRRRIATGPKQTIEPHPGDSPRTSVSADDRRRITAEAQRMDDD